MSAPVRRARRVDRDRRFDLRTTALFFLLLALLVCALGFLARAALHFAENRPLWAGALALLGIAVAWLSRSRWRRFSAARCARRTAQALEEAAETASDSLGATTADEDAQPAVPTGAPGEPPAGTAAPVSDPGEACPPRWTRQTGAVPLSAADDTEAAAPDRVADCAELDAEGFEQAVARLCERDGCRDVEVVGGAGDLGADVVAVTRDGRRLVIQCKRYGDANKVGSQDMQRFGGTCFTVHEADIAAVVTTSDFTAPALAYADQCGIVCVNGREVEAWWHGTGPSPWEYAVSEH
ncbi:restriction endonuclease [Streptomyces albus subsp. chlorinus]|uniref:restriction endonuclease n=1 Tax=Streptomyces albus TaxID=1888 RepID=UPI00157156DC|nr:restriction endonuclease [Streptomyces albus]NSC20004.1 restriction endonuclease [Streptomyces albus subsp. chlorinus]